MPTYEVVRLDDRDEVIEHSVFASMSDASAVHVARAVAMVGGKVLIWRNGCEMEMLGQPESQGEPIPKGQGSLPFPLTKEMVGRDHAGLLGAPPR